LIVFFVGVGLALSNWASLIVLALVLSAGLLVRIFRGASIACRVGRGLPALCSDAPSTFSRPLVARSKAVGIG
jgi:hypothetical protein